MSTALDENSSGTFSMNLSYHVGDDPGNVQSNRDRFFSSLGIEERHIAFTQQKHTNTVVFVSTPGVFPVSDGLVSSQKSLYLAVSAADCIPVMMYDPVSKTVAGVHAGWRGTNARIVHAAVDIMTQKCAALPSDIRVFIGPSAGKCCYEVREDVALLFPEECREPYRDGKYLLDVKQANVLQLIKSGLRKENIEVHPDCTIHNPAYHSFRRDGSKSGRMFAVIGLLP